MSKTCLQCNKELVNPKRTFCSRSCSSKHNGRAAAEAISTVLKTRYHKSLEDVPFDQLPLRAKKRFLFEKFGNVCPHCHFSYTDPKTGKGPFNIHHIDGDNTNWALNNLIVLCLNCHWMTDNYGFKKKKHSAVSKEKISKSVKRHYKVIGPKC